MEKIWIPLLIDMKNDRNNVQLSHFKGLLLFRIQYKREYKGILVKP